jgi:hypothetical protein
MGGRGWIHRRSRLLERAWLNECRVGKRVTSREDARPTDIIIVPPKEIVQRLEKRDPDYDIAANQPTLDRWSALDVSILDTIIIQPQPLNLDCLLPSYPVLISMPGVAGYELHKHISLLTKTPFQLTSHLCPPSLVTKSSTSWKEGVHPLVLSPPSTFLLPTLSTRLRTAA